MRIKYTEILTQVGVSTPHVIRMTYNFSISHDTTSSSHASNQNTRRTNFFRITNLLLMAMATIHLI